MENTENDTTERQSKKIVIYFRGISVIGAFAEESEKITEQQ